MSFQIDDNICTASTLPGSYYCDPKIYEAHKESVFAPSWQFIDRCPQEGDAEPVTLLEGCLDEPIVITKADGQLHYLSNVCTHRAAIIVTENCKHKTLRCGYHGRRFRHDGQFVSMPGFVGACNFPGAADNLAKLAHRQIGPLNFVSIKPNISFEKWIAPLKEKMPWYDFEALPDRATHTQTYEFDANWALYCDNYLEGFHVPFVHPGLNQAIDLQSYEVETFQWGTMQTALPAAEEPVFPDGKSAYYFWLFPNLMLNFYPWGLSVNVVIPQGLSRTRVVFFSLVTDETKRDVGAGADLDQVELEDEAVVELVQRGVRSRMYDRGRYSPEHEKSVHRFHQLLADCLVPTI
jgi:choline monooxygenase